MHKPNPFGGSVLGSYFMKINDMLTKWILKTYSMWEKCVQILYSSINNSKINQKLTKYPNSRSDSDGISPLHPYYSRDCRSTSHLRASLAKGRCFSRCPGVCFQWFLRFQEGFSNSWKIVFFITYGSKKISHEPNHLRVPYSAHILWKLMIFWPNKSSRRILCRKNVYRSCTAQ